MRSNKNRQSKNLPQKNWFLYPDRSFRFRKMSFLKVGLLHARFTVRPIIGYLDFLSLMKASLN